MNWTTVFIVAVILITLDKGLTVMNIVTVAKNHPDVDPYSIERNPLAKLSFQKFGLGYGTVLYWFLSLGTFYIALYFLSTMTKLWAPGNAYGAALYILVIFYAFVVANNFYFFLRYSKLL